jgi:hypothetical protein
MLVFLHQHTLDSSSTVGDTELMGVYHLSFQPDGFERRAPSKPGRRAVIERILGLFFLCTKVSSNKDSTKADVEYPKAREC